MEQTSREATITTKQQKTTLTFTHETTHHQQSQSTHESDTRHSLYPVMNMRMSCGYMR